MKAGDQPTGTQEHRGHEQPKECRWRIGHHGPGNHLNQRHAEEKETEQYLEAHQELHRCDRGFPPDRFLHPVEVRRAFLAKPRFDDFTSEKRKAAGRRHRQGCPDHHRRYRMRLPPADTPSLGGGATGFAGLSLIISSRASGFRVGKIKRRNRSLLGIEFRLAANCLWYKS